MNNRQDLSNLLQTKFIITPQTSKKFGLDLKKIISSSSKPIELLFVIHQAAKVDLKIVGFGELMVGLNLRIELMGVDSEALVEGALVMHKKSCVKLNVWQNHLTPNAQSDVKIKTVLLDAAQFEYFGTIFIAEHASETVANQENKNIIVSSDASVKSVPHIEVLNSDVQCGHGSAVGGLDQEQLWYLMSRGLSHKLAVNVLLNSFLGSNFNFDYE